MSRTVARSANRSIRTEVRNVVCTLLSSYPSTVLERVVTSNVPLNELVRRLATEHRGVAVVGALPVVRHEANLGPTLTPGVRRALHVTIRRNFILGGVEYKYGRIRYFRLVNTLGQLARNAAVRSRVENCIVTLAKQRGQKVLLNEVTGEDARFHVFLHDIHNRVLTRKVKRVVA